MHRLKRTVKFTCGDYIFKCEGVVTKFDGYSKLYESTVSEEKETNFTLWGHNLEDAIRKHFEKVNGVKVTSPNFIFQSDEYPFMIGNFDGIVTELDGTKAILEIKTSI